MGDSSIGQARALRSHLRQELDACRPHVTLSNMHGLDCNDYMGTRANLYAGVWCVSTWSSGCVAPLLHTGEAV